MVLLEQISGWLIAGVLPILYVTVLIGVIEALLIWGHSRLGFRGVCPLNSSDIRGEAKLPDTDDPYFGRVGQIEYCLAKGGDLRFVGRPGIRPSGYYLRARAVDLGERIRLEVRAPLSMCLGFTGLCMLFVGLTVSGFLADGLATGIVYIAIGAAVIAMFRWRVSSQVASTRSFLEDVLEDVEELECEPYDDQAPL